MLHKNSLLKKVNYLTEFLDKCVPLFSGRFQHVNSSFQAIYQQKKLIHICVIFKIVLVAIWYAFSSICLHLWGGQEPTSNGKSVSIN